jgi:exopolyphosphatase / guanosine-5'-triphosphate,3'-diphosphate pyrophosphatase
VLPDPVAIIDIGSNSVRLVVYAGPARNPSAIFNEKVMAGLGKDLPKTGRLPDEAQKRALGALLRFRLLTRQMGVKHARVVATAAVRDAENGADFLASIRKAGFDPELLSGEEEGIMAGQGVLSGIPEANGIVGDLGGGSLELVDVADGEVRHSGSTPFGVLRIGPPTAKTEAGLRKKLAKALDALDFRRRGRKRTLYLVGGSWRSLARLDMLVTGYPLPIVHQYRMAAARAAELFRTLTGLKAELRNVHLPDARVPTLPQAALLLKVLVEELKPSDLVVSSYGIREGLLYDDLDEKTRRRDPLIEAAREAGRGLGRFDEHGALLDRWIGPIFDDAREASRLRLASCLLADVAWAAHPDFRAERGVDMALHGNWVGIDGPGRVMLAQALFANYGGGRDFPDLDAARLCRPDQLRRASQWGLAMRLAQRLSGGTAAGLERSRLRLRDSTLRLELRKGDEPLYGESVERRHKTLASAMGLGVEAVAV